MYFLFDQPTVVSDLQIMISYNEKKKRENIDIIFSYLLGSFCFQSTKFFNSLSFEIQNATSIVSFTTKPAENISLDENFFVLFLMLWLQIPLPPF